MVWWGRGVSTQGFILDITMEINGSTSLENGCKAYLLYWPLLQAPPPLPSPHEYRIVYAVLHLFARKPAQLFMCLHCRLCKKCMKPETLGGC